MEVNPQESMVEEREELMVSPTGGNPFLRTAHFLIPTFPPSIDEPPFKFPRCFSSLPHSRFEPNQWPVKVEFRGWQLQAQKDWNTWVDHMASVHQSTWKKAGIYEAIFSSTYQIRRKAGQAGLVYGFAEKWCSETNTFIFPWGEATITLEDVMVLGGFSVLGDSVLSPLRSHELKEIEKKLLEERKEFSRGPSKKANTTLWFKKFIKSEHEFEHEAFLVYWLSRYVFQDGNITKKPVFSIAIQLARGTRIALAPAVLASIYRDLGFLQRMIVASNQLKIGDAALNVIIQSPFQLVQVWAWERFLELGPRPKAINYGEPRMARWDQVDCLVVENLRMILGSAGGDFKWRPYAMAIENWHLPKYYAQNEKWVFVGTDLDDELQSFVRCLRVSELVGLGTIEHYLPHRVAMQFGFDQDLPCSVSGPKHNSDIAWKQYMKEIENVKLYLPCRLFEADVTTKYLKWWKKSVSALKDASEAAVPQKKKEKSMDSSLLMANHPAVPPGFPPKCNSTMEAGDPVDDDEVTESEFLKYRKNRENFKIRQDGGSEKLSGQVPNLACPIGEESSVNTMKSNKDIVSPAGNECRPSSSSSFEKRDSELQARFKRLECVVEELKANRSGTSTFMKS